MSASKGGKTHGAVCGFRGNITVQEVCEDCDESCKHCFGPGPESCVTCHTGFGLHAVTRHCLRCCQPEESTKNCCLCHSASGPCWRQSYERLRGTAGTMPNLRPMPHGVPEPEDSGDEAEAVYTSRDGSIYRRYGFVKKHEPEEEEADDANENTLLNKA